jgi:hypothetical protein
MGNAVNATLYGNLNYDFLRDIAPVAGNRSPATYLKVCAMLVPKEMKVEHQGRLGQLTDEQLDQAIAMLDEMIARKAGDRPTPRARRKVVPNLPAPAMPPGHRERTS